MFVSVPPRTQRLVHSEAYLRYIEGLTSGGRSIGGWEKSLYAEAPENTSAAYGGTAAEKLPTHWLANGAGHHENTVSALWALRDLMLKDAVVISRTLDFAQL
jgi:protein polybromo-1